MGSVLTSIKEVSVNLEGIKPPSIQSSHWSSVGIFDFFIFIPPHLCPSIQEDLCVFILSVLTPLGLAPATSGLSALSQGVIKKKKKA